MFNVILAMILEFFILAVPAYILFKKLYPKPSKTKFSGTLSQEQAIEFRTFLLELDTYLKENTEYFGLFFTNPILYEYTRYFIETKSGIFKSKIDGNKKTSREEYSSMIEIYGDELFHSSDIKMNFLSFGYGNQIYFTSHGFVHFCKWLREIGLFDAILVEMYNTVELTNGCGMTAERIGELVKLFDDVRQLSPEYEERFKPFIMDELLNLSQSIISPSSSNSQSGSSSDEDYDKQFTTSKKPSTATTSLDSQIDAILQQIIADVSLGRAMKKNGDISGIEDEILQNSGKIVEVLKLMNANNTDSDSEASDSDPSSSIQSESANTTPEITTSNIDNPQLAKEIEQLDEILKSEHANESQSGGILNAIYAIFGKSAYLSDDFGNSN
jgi:hypothetical protein